MLSIPKSRQGKKIMLTGALVALVASAILPPAYNPVVIISNLIAKFRA